MVTFVNLLIRWEYHEALLLDRLNSAFGFDHNIFLAHSSEESNRFISNMNRSHCTPQSSQTFQNFDDDGIKLRNLETFRMIGGKNELLIVAVPKDTKFDKTLLSILLLVKEIQLLKVNIKIGIFFSTFVPNDDLKNLFEWLWSKRIINVFAAFHFNGEPHPQSLNVFNFNPFGTFKVVNITGGEYHIHSTIPFYIEQFSLFLFSINLSLTLFFTQRKMSSTFFLLTK